MTQEEEFEFRSRLEQEQSAKVGQIPTAGPQAPQGGERVTPRSYLESALMGAAMVPPLAVAARGAQALVQGTRAAPYAANLAKALIPTSGKALLLEGGLGAASGVGGEFAARQVPAEYGPLAEMAGGAAGGMAAGGLFGNVARIANIKDAAGGLFSSSKDIANQLSKVAGSGKASNQALTALVANPSLAGTIARAGEIEASTGISLPMLAAANGDTTISSFMQSQIAKGDNSPFTAKVKQQYEAAEKALTEAQRGVAPSMQEVDAYMRKKASEALSLNTQQQAAKEVASIRRVEGRQNIDDRIKELTAELQQAPGRADVGERLTNLIKTKQRVAQAEVGPQYDKLLNESEANGLMLPGEAAKSLKEFVTDKTSQDVFNKFPTLYRAINRVFRGETKPVSTNMQEKYTLAKQEPTFKDYSLKDLDSLKRETNEALRNAQAGSDQQRMLRELKSQVDGAIDSVSPEFSQAYRAIDKEYAAKVGLPFNEKGVVNINRASFVDTAVPQMTKNASSLKQTMDIIGDSPEGLQIVKDAFLFDIGNNKSIINTATGELNTNQLKRYIATNKEKIDMVPGLRDSLEGLAGRVDVLRDNRTAILEAEKAAKVEAIENLWTKAYGTSGGMQAVVRDALTTPAKLDELLAVAGKSRVAKEGIKSALLDDLVSVPGDRLAILENNKSAISKLFGVDETKRLTDIVEASQRLKDNPFKMNINVNTISKTEMEKAFGSKPETTAGELRNQFISAPRVLINHISRYLSNQANKNEAAEVQKFLLDPKALKETADLIQELDVRGFTSRAASLLSKLGKNTASNWLLGATVGGAVGAQERPSNAFTPEPAMLEGFAQ